MHVEQTHWSEQDGWQARSPGATGADAHLVLVFGARRLLTAGAALADLRRAYPGAVITGCSTAGEICGDRVLDDTVVATALTFASAQCVMASVPLTESRSSAEAGTMLAARLPDHDRLRHVIVFSDGLNVNGSELVQGLTRGLPSHLAVTGGLSADGPHFQDTVVVTGTDARSRVIVAVGLYGASLQIGYASLGGWDVFGPVRIITRSRGNVLYELDGQSALALYRRYLGEQAADLPASGLLFPLKIRAKDSDTGVVRTILGVNDADDSMTFAGDIPEGAYAQLMRANFDRLVDGAIGAARVSLQGLQTAPECALLISCVGRKMVLQQRVEEELEGVRDIMGPSTILSGFYSYGEIAPFAPTAPCELHNQTMTITTLSER